MIGRFRLGKVGLHGVAAPFDNAMIIGVSPRIMARAELWFHPGVNVEVN